MKKIFGLMTLCICAVAQAVTPAFTVTWVAPKLNTDGSAIVGPITYQLYSGASGAEVKLGTPVTSPPYVVNNPAPAPGATLCIYVTAIVAGVESAPSLEACGTVPKPAPNAPATVVITIK